MSIGRTVGAIAVPSYTFRTASSADVSNALAAGAVSFSYATAPFFEIIFPEAIALTGATVVIIHTARVALMTRCAVFFMVVLFLRLGSRTPKLIAFQLSLL